MLLTTLTSYCSARAMRRVSGAAARRAVRDLGVAASLLPLLYFKYLRYAASLLSGLFALPALELPQQLLPVGISFYIFGVLSYLLDVYRGAVEPQRHFGYYALYVCFFPQIASGPISRAGTLLTQLLRGDPFERLARANAPLRIAANYLMPFFLLLGVLTAGESIAVEFIYLQF